MDIKDKYNKTIKGINDGVDSFNRGVVAVVKFLVTALIFILIIAGIVAFLGSCNPNMIHPD